VQQAAQPNTYISTFKCFFCSCCAGMVSASVMVLHIQNPCRCSQLLSVSSVASLAVSRAALACSVSLWCLIAALVIVLLGCGSNKIGSLTGSL